MEAVVFIVFFSIFYFKFDSTEDIVDEKSTAHLEGPAVNHTWCPVLSPHGYCSFISKWRSVLNMH